MKNQRGNILPSLLGGIALVLLLIFGGWAIASYKKVPAGHVGVHVYLLGGEKGVDAVTRPVGRHWIGFQQELYLYPTFTQNVQWKADDAAGNRAIEFSDIDGTRISADIGLSYNVDPTKAAMLFQTHRKGIEEITDLVIRQRVADALNSEASQLKVESIYGRGREALLQRVQERVAKQVSASGIRIEKLSWIGAPRLPEGVQKALNAKIEATQIAARRENEVQATIAEAVKAREQAKGEADAVILRAEAEAKSIQIKGDALRNNQELVAMTLAERWDGKLPQQYLGGGGKEGVILQLLQK